MKIENLKEGMVLKNYPELCKVLEVPVKTGYSKKRQMEWFDGYFIYEKDGYSFIIKEIINTEVEPMEDRRGGSRNNVTYIAFIEKLLLDLMLRNGGEQKLVMSKTQLIKSLHMANANFGVGKSNIPKASKVANVNTGTAEDWFSSTGGMLEGNINRAIKNLESQSLISSSIITTVCVRDIIRSEMVKTGEKGLDRHGRVIDIYKMVALETEEVYRQAYDDEEVAIIEAEKVVLKDMDCSDKQQVVLQKKWKEFTTKVYKILHQETDIKRYYKSYCIHFSEKYAKERTKQLEDLLTEEERERYQAILNDSVKERIEVNAKRRQELTPSCFGKPKRARARKDYIEHTNKLSELFVDRESPNLYFELTQKTLN